MHVILLEYSRYFTGNFKSGSHAILPAIGMQNCLLLQAKVHAICKQETSQLQAKTPAIAGKNTRNRRRKYPQSQAKNPNLQAKIAAIAGNLLSHRW